MGDARDEWVALVAAARPRCAGATRACRELLLGLEVVQTGVGNFFDNLSGPTTILHQFLQGKFKEGTQDTGRFLLNTTLGWGGVIDVASGGQRALRPVHGRVVD